MKFSELAKYMPASTIEAAANGQLRLNLGTLTKNTLTLDSSIIESVGKILQAAHEYTSVVNQKKAENNLAPILFVNKLVRVSENNNPVYVFTVEIEINSAATYDAVIDPAL